MKLFIFFALAYGLSGQTTGSISGTLVDNTGASVPRGDVRLLPDRATRSGDNGEFAFTDVPPGPWRMNIAAKGFAAKTIEGELKAGETAVVPPVTLAVDSVNTAVDVTQTEVELAQAQIREEETQRLFGLLPNFFTVYDRNAVPLNTQQKFELTAKSWLDPSAFVVEGVIAGVGQAQNNHKGFGQGAKGYAKRYGAGFADYGTSLFLENVVLTTAFRQDPRYFYKGSGSAGSRFRYALSRTFICRGDNKKDQVCYSTLISNLASGFITNYYYPAADRDPARTILKNGAIGIGADALANLFQEFLARRITRRR